MGTLLVLLVSLGLGVLAHAHWRLAPQVLKVARGWVIWVALPAVILKEIPKLTIGQDAVLALVAGWWVFVGALGFCLALGQLWGWSRGTVAALVLTAGLGNTSFVGLPAIRLLVGESGIGPAVLCDQLGSFLPLAVGGALIVAWGKGEGVSWSSIVAKLVTFPPTIALVLALSLHSVALHPSILVVLGSIAATLSPVALFAVGLAAARPAMANMRALGAGLVWKLVLAPLGVVAMAAWLNTDAHWAHVTVLQSAMAPMVTGGIVASSAGLEPELASQMVVLGLFASVVTLPLWNMMF